MTNGSGETPKQPRKLPYANTEGDRIIYWKRRLDEIEAMIGQIASANNTQYATLTQTIPSVMTHMRSERDGISINLLELYKRRFVLEIVYFEQSIIYVVNRTKQITDPERRHKAFNVLKGNASPRIARLKKDLPNIQFSGAEEKKALDLESRLNKIEEVTQDEEKFLEKVNGLV